MTDFDTRKWVRAAAASASTAATLPFPLGRKPGLSPAAVEVAAQYSPPAYSPIVVAGFVRLAECALVILTGLAVYVSYVVPSDGFEWYYVASILGISLVSLLAFQAADIYQIQAFRGHEKQYMRLASAWSVVFLIVIGISFFAKAGENSDVKVIGVFDDRSGARTIVDCAGRPKLGNVDELVEFARRTRVDLVIFALPISAENRILQMLKKLWVLPVDIRLSAHSNKLRFRPRSYSYLGNVPVLDVADRPIADWDIVMKWLFDKLVGSLMLIGLTPVMLLIALAIKLDSRGPVFFKQKRYGFNNELIEVYKFRSMYMEQTDATASKLVSKNDLRVTRVGRFIRKSSLDELPQLINVVFKGNLSLVGPRPHAIHAKAADQLYDDAVDGYFARHRVKPGITGWAQINGWRGETDTEEKIRRRVEHDLYYIENWSVLFDLYILARTPSALAKAQNAY